MTGNPSVHQKLRSALATENSKIDFGFVNKVRYIKNPTNFISDNNNDNFCKTALWVIYGGAWNALMYVVCVSMFLCLSMVEHCSVLERAEDRGNGGVNAIGVLAHDLTWKVAFQRNQRGFQNIFQLFALIHLLCQPCKSLPTILLEVLIKEHLPQVTFMGSKCTLVLCFDRRCHFLVSLKISELLCW